MFLWRITQSFGCFDDDEFIVGPFGMIQYAETELARLILQWHE